MRAALIRYARWLRANYEFPVRVPVYLSGRAQIIGMSGDRVSASCFVPWDRTEEPYIRIATGDFAAMKKGRSLDDCLASYLVSLAHEVVHYRQWIEHGDVGERGVKVRARAMVERYAETVEHP